MEEIIKYKKKKYKKEIPKTQSLLACTCKVKGSDFSSRL